MRDLSSREPFKGLGLRRLELVSGRLEIVAPEDDHHRGGTLLESLLYECRGLLRRSVRIAEAPLENIGKKGGGYHTHAEEHDPHGDHDPAEPVRKLT